MFLNRVRGSEHVIHVRLFRVMSDFFLCPILSLTPCTAVYIPSCLRWLKYSCLNQCDGLQIDQLLCDSNP